MLLYGAGLRIQDCLELRVKDLDFDRPQIVVRRGKKQKDRRTMLPTAVRERLQTHLNEVKRQHERDLAKGLGRVVLPFALERKYPKAATEWAWQFVFPARTHLPRSAMGSTLAVSPPRDGRPESGEQGGAAGRLDEARQPALFSSFIRNAFT